MKHFLTTKKGQFSERSAPSCPFSAPKLFTSCLFRMVFVIVLKQYFCYTIIATEYYSILLNPRRAAPPCGSAFLFPKSSYFGSYFVISSLNDYIKTHAEDINVLRIRGCLGHDADTKKERLDFSNRSGGIYVDMQEKGCMLQLCLYNLHVSDN